MNPASRENWLLWLSTEELRLELEKQATRLKRNVKGEITCLKLAARDGDKNGMSGKKMTAREDVKP